MIRSPSPTTAHRRRQGAAHAVRAVAGTLALLAALTLAAAVSAHELRPAVAELTPDDDVLEIALRVNVEALLAGIGVEHEDTDDSPQANVYDRLRALEPAALRERLERFLPDLLEGIELRDESDTRLVPVLNAAELPPVGDVRVARDSTLRLEVPLPTDTGQLFWRWPKAFGPVIVRSSLADGPGSFSVYLLAGERSEALPLGRGAGNGATIGAGDVAGTTSYASTIGNYLRVGFVHILPLGLDHILFVVGLFLLSPYARPMLWQVTTFTLAHTVTLALASLDIVAVPTHVVEPLIALSITAVCVENLFATRLHRWRLGIVFGFGLLHGLGFASVLQDVGGDATAFVTSLIAFNVGVELGQLAVVLACFAAVGWWFRDRSWYRRIVTVPASLAIGAIGLFWFVQRIAG